MPFAMCHPSNKAHQMDQAAFTSVSAPKRQLTTGIFFGQHFLSLGLVPKGAHVWEGVNTSCHSSRTSTGQQEGE